MRQFVIVGYDHERLPAVEREDLVPQALTVRSFDALSAPPSDLPARETGQVFAFEDRPETETTPDVTYDLVPSNDLEHVSAFTGPQLSFEFAVLQAVEDDFGGRLYDAPIDGPDAVYVHREGAYTSEVRDADDAVGAFPVDPADEDRIEIDRPDTGKTPLATFLATISDEIRADVEGLDLQGQSSALSGLTRALESVGSAAGRAADRASEGDRAGADRQLQNVGNGLEQALESEKL